MRKICQAVFTLYVACLLFLTLIPFRFRLPAIHHLPWPIGPSQFEHFDFWANIFLFIPFGFLLHFILPTVGVPTKKNGYDSVWNSLIIGGGLSFTIETLQIIIPARFPSFGDLFTNTFGAGVGALIGIFFETKNLHLYLFTHRQKIIVASFFLYATFLFSLPFISQEPIALWRNDARILIGNNVEQARPWKGSIVSLAVYDKQLSDRQIKQHFQMGTSSPSSENPILLYRFDKPVELALQDQSAMMPLLNLQFNGPAQKKIEERGMNFTGAFFLISEALGDKIYERINVARQFAIEVWFYPSRQFDHGGRIISFANMRHDLFYLRQSRDEMSFAIEGNEFKKVRLDWENVEDIFIEGNRPVHIVGVYHWGELLLYFNGKEVQAGHIGNGFFLLSSRFNFERMDFGGHGLLVLLLFGSFGFLLAMISQNKSARIRIFKVVLGLFFIALILIIEGQQTPSFFTLRIVWVPPMAFLMGFIVGAHPRIRPF